MHPLYNKIALATHYSNRIYWWWQCVLVAMVNGNELVALWRWQGWDIERGYEPGLAQKQVPYEAHVLKWLRHAGVAWVLSRSAARHLLGSPSKACWLSREPVTGCTGPSTNLASLCLQNGISFRIHEYINVS